MCTPKWRSILVDWVNCLQDIQIKELTELADGSILLKIIGQLVATKAPKEFFTTVEQFLRTKYPTFDSPEQSICDGGESTITTAVTLMMHYACVRSNNVDIRKTMCTKLTAVDQQTIMEFNTFIMKNSLETSDDLRLAIAYACRDDSENSEAIEPQAMSEATPPATRLLHDQRMEIRRLRADLEAERFDRTYLQEELKKLQHTTNKLTEHREKSQKQISLLKSLLESAKSPKSPVSETVNDTTQQNNRLGRQLQELEDRLANVQAEMDEVTKERDSFKIKLESMRLEKEKWLERASEQGVRAERALQQAADQRDQVSALQEQVADLRTHLLRSHEPHDSSAMLDTDDFDSSTRFRSAADFSAISEDLCTNVVEVQLSEQRVLCEGLQKKLEAVKEDLAKMTKEKDIVVEANEMLCDKIKSFEADQTDLYNIVQNQQALLLTQMEHLHTLSLNVQSKCENEINKILTELNHLLTDPKTRIVDNFQENVKLLLRINNVATQLINELQAKNDEKNIVITHLRRNVMELNESLQICENDKKYLSEGVKTIMDVNDTVINKKCAEKIDDLKKRIDVLNNLINVLSVKTKSVFYKKNANIEKLQNELELEKQKNNLLEVKSDEIISETNEKIKTIKNLIVVKDSNIFELEEQQRNIKSSISDLKNDLEREIQEKQTLDLAFEEAKKNLKNMEIEITSKENYVLELKEKHDNLKTTLTESRNELKVENQQRTAVQVELMESKNEMEILKAEVASNGVVISKLEEEHLTLKSFIKSTQEENEKLNSDLMEMGEQMDQLTCAFEDEKTARNTLIIKTEKCLQEKDKSIFDLSDSLQLEKRSNNALSNKVLELESKISSLTETISSLNNEAIELKLFQKKYNDIIVTLKREREEFASKESALKTNLSITENNLTEMTEEKTKLVTVLENERITAKQTIENLNNNLKSSTNTLTVTLKEKSEFDNELKVIKAKLDQTEMVLYKERDLNVENVAKLKSNIATNARKHDKSLESYRIKFIEMKNMYEILCNESEKQKAMYKIMIDEKISLENDIAKCKKHISELDSVNNEHLAVISKHETNLAIRKNIVNEYIGATFNLNNQNYKLQEKLKIKAQDFEMEKNLVRETKEQNKALNIKYDNLVKAHKKQLEYILHEQEEKQKVIMKYIEDEIRSKKSELEENLKEMSIEVKENQITIGQNFEKLKQMEKKLDAKMADVGLKEKRICILNNVVTEFKRQVTDLDSSLTKVTKVKQSLEKDLEKKESEIIQLNSRLNENMRENNNLNAELEQMKHTHDKLLSMFVYDKEDLAKVTKVKDDLEKHVKLTEEKCDKLLVALENEQKYNAELNIKLEIESISKTESSSEKHKLIDQIKQLKVNSEELLVKLQKERSNWEENVTNLEMNLASKEGVLFTVIQEKNEISTELDICKKDYEFTISGLLKEIIEKSETMNTLEKELSVKEETLKKKNQDNTDLRIECNRLSTLLESYNLDLTSKVDLLKENDKVISELRTKIDLLLATIEKEIQNKTEIISKLEEDLISKEEVVSNMSTENDMLKNELQRCEEFKVKYENMKSIEEKIVEEHEKKLNELKVSLESKLESEVNIKNIMESKYNELTISYEKMQTDHTTTVSDLNKLLEDVKKQSEERAIQIDSLEELLEERTDEFNALLGKLDALTEKQDQLEDGNVETIHDYEEQLRAKTEELHRLGTKISVIVQDKNSIENEFKEISNEVLKLRREINEKSQEVENNGTQNCALRFKFEQLIDNKENEIQSCQAKIEDLTEEMDSLKLFNKKLQAELDQQANHLEKLNADFNACQIDAKNLKVVNSQFEANNSVHCKEIQDLKTTILSLENDFNDSVKEKDDALRKYNTLKDNFADYYKTMSSLIHKFSSFIASMDKEDANYDMKEKVDSIVELVEEYLNRVSEFRCNENINDTLERPTSESEPCLLGIELKKVSSLLLNIKKDNLEKQKKSFNIHFNETCHINDLSEKINVLNDSLIKRNNEVEELLNMIRDKETEILTLKNEVESLSNELTSLKEEQNVNADKLETVICEKNSQITNFHREVTYLKTIIAESENKLMDVKKELKDASEKLATVNKEKNDAIAYLQQQSAKLQEKLKLKDDGNVTFKLSSKLQTLIHQWNIENRNALALQELTHLSNITDDENSAFEKRNIFDRRNSTFKSESGVTLDQLEGLLESSVKRDKLSSDRINLLQQEREHLMLQNKSFKYENEALKKSVLALKERTQANENTQSKKCLNELSAYFKTFSSVRNTYKLKLQNINSIQKLIKKEILQIKSMSPESVTSLEKQYFNNIEETFDIVFSYADWSERCVDQSVSNVGQSHSSLNVSDIQNITLEIQLDQLVTTFSNLLEETGKLYRGVKNGPPVPSRRNLAGHAGPYGARSDPNEVHQRVSEVRAEYEDKLTRMKAKMKQLYQEQIAVYKERQSEELSNMERELCKERATLTERTKAYQQHVASLTDELWKVGERLLVEKNEADWLRKKRQSSSLLSLQNTSSATGHTGRGTGRPSRALDTQSLRSVRESEKSESGGLHMSDEEGEVFDNRWLKELSCTPKTSGPGARQTNDAFDNQRYSELRWRNSLCPPHLKSSYPAETQFHTTATYAEQHIKNELEARAQPIRKEVGITAYKKPGPPTPSKNAGRLSATDSELRESVRTDPDAAVSKKNATPSRLKSLLGMGTSRTEQDNTPKSRRLSIFRKNR